jgi:hypothetical protein
MAEEIEDGMGNKLKLEVGMGKKKNAEFGMWPPASPSCRLYALRARSHRGGAYAPAGSRNAEVGNIRQRAQGARHKA